MGRQLYETQPVFRAALDRCAKILESCFGSPLLEILFLGSTRSSFDIHQTAYTQPALFAFEYALAEMWRSWGIEPHAVLGHSVGEYVAACIAGVFSLEDGLRLIAERATSDGRASSQRNDGGCVCRRVARGRCLEALSGSSFHRRREWTRQHCHLWRKHLPCKLFWMN